MSIKAVVTAHSMSQKTLNLKQRINKFREKLMVMCNEIEQDAKVQYTGWFVLLKKTEGGFESLGVFNPVISETGTEPEWNLCLPIPEPESFREFMGW